MKDMKVTAWILAALVATAPLAALAQRGGGGGFDMSQFGGGGGSQRPSTPWKEFKLDPKKKVQLTFRNSNIDAVIDLISRVSGVTIVKDPTLRDPVTVVSPKPVGLNEAFEILNAAITVRGYSMEKSGNVLMIKKNQTRGGQGGGMTGGMGGMTPEMLAQLMRPSDPNSSNELKVYKIKFANASDLARVVNDVFLQQQQNTNPFAAMMGGGGGFGGRGGRGGGGFNFGGLGGQQQGATVRASSDDFSNSVIVNAPKSKQLEVEILIEEIDKPTDAPLVSKTYKMEFAAASELVAVIQNVLNANTPTGRGGATANQPLSQRFGFQALLSGRQQGAGTVTADDRTNALIVSATAENQKVVADLIKELDKDVEVVNTTYVFRLDNARAQDIADLMNQTFGRTNATGNRTNAGTGNRTNTNNRRTNTGNRNTGNNGGLGGNTGRSPQANIDEDGQLEVDADGNLLTDVYVQQGNFRPGGQGFNLGGQRTNTQNNSDLVRGADGRLTNARDLAGQVQVIPDPNTNSLIIVTNPDNLKLIQDILLQLDHIPEQVMIETMIVEATLDKTNKFGVEWTFAQPKAFGSTGVTGTGQTGFGLGSAVPALDGFRYTLAGGNLQAFVNLLQKDDKFQVLSTPRIFTSNNVEAEINISQSVPYITSTRTDATGAITYNYDFQDVGIVLTVTPRITKNGYVTLEVSQTANDLQGFTDFNAPIVNKRQADTTVSVKDTETIVLGGIMRSVVNSKVKKVPLLGDIPLLGELFKSTDRTNTKTELMVFLTPRIVRDNEEARKMKEETVEQLSPGVKSQIDSAKPNKVTTGTSTKSDKGNKGGGPKQN